MKDSDLNKLHWLYGGALIVIGIFLVLAIIAVSSQADNITGQVSISNVVAPTVPLITLSATAYAGTYDYASGITIPSWGTETVHVNGTVSDVNGWDDINTVSVTFYRSAYTGGACNSGTTDNNYCYINAACDTQNGSGATLEYDCPITLEYWADATDSPDGTYSGETWDTDLVVVDNGALQGASSMVGIFEVNTVTALLFTDHILWGTMNLGVTTTAGTNVDQSIFQSGNDVADIEPFMVATGLNCTFPTGIAADIPVGNIEWDLNDDGFATGGTSLSATPTATSLDVPLRTSEIAPMAKLLYWDITIPASGIGGTCTETISLNVVPS